MTMMSDLSEDLVEEILSRVPITSLRVVRSTCKQWNGISKDRILCKGEVRHEFLGFIMKNSKVCSLRFDLNGIHNEDGEFVESSMKQVGKFNQVKIFQVFHCDGLLLLVTKEVNSTRLVVWNPYLGQTRCIIKPRNNYHLSDMYVLGYDNNRNHKILRYLENYQIYDFKSSSWRVLDVIPESVLNFPQNSHSVSLKGNTYFFSRGEKIGEAPAEIFLLCFDFTRERFGPRLPLPFHINDSFDTVALSSIRYEQLAVLFINWDTSAMEIWVTTKIEPNAVSWRNFLTSAITHFKLKLFAGSFFIDQEKKLAVLFDISIIKNHIRNVAYIIGENGYLRTVDLGESELHYASPLVSSYAPSLVQINKGQELSRLLIRLFCCIL